jgi:coatomer subunit beta'
MHVAFNPKDNNTFASASMDRTVKIWNVGSPTANFTLQGHSKGVNCVEYYEGGDKPYVITGADDKLIKVWDYQQKTCVQTLEGHTNNVVRVGYHPLLPIIVSGSEDGTIRVWHSHTYRLENTLNYGMERVWCLAFLKGSNDLAFGYDEGTISIKIGKEEPTISMDQSGKIVWAKQNEIQQVDVRQDGGYLDGERIVLPVKDLGSCEVYPQLLQHSPNGRFAVVCGDGEYIIYTALSWRNKAFGQGLEFVWSSDSNEYAIRESTSKIKLFRSFKEKTNVFVRPNFAAEGIFGGPLLGVKSASFVMFYDWETGVVARRIDVNCTRVYWSDSDIVAIATPDSFYVLKFHRTVFQNHLENGVDGGDEGYEDAFEFVCEVPEIVSNGVWVGDCFVYTNTANRLNFLVGDQSSTISHFDFAVYVLGFIGRDSRVYICDKHLNIMSFGLPLMLIDYQNAVLRGDLQKAQELLPSVPIEQRNKVAKFLESQGHKKQALEITTDAEHRFELAMQLNSLDIAYQVASQLEHEDKWKQLGDTALQMWNYGMALECWKRAHDLESCLLIYQTSGNADGLKDLARLAMEKGEANIAFTSLFLVGEVVQCVDLLVDTQRLPEAAFFARTYCPGELTRVVSLWKQSLKKVGKSKLADGISNPVEYTNLFPDYEATLHLEKLVGQIGLLPAENYHNREEIANVDLLTGICF